MRLTPAIGGIGEHRYLARRSPCSEFSECPQPMIDQMMLMFGIRFRFRLDNSWRILLRVGGRAAVSELKCRIQSRDPESIRNGDFGKHFPT
jgi:hypothetical protein